MLTADCKKTGVSYVDDYAEKILSGARPAGKRLKRCVQYALRRLTDDGVTIDEEKTEQAKELIEDYTGLKLFDWELFLLACIHAYVNDDVLFRRFLIVMGTGNGKNGFISALAWYFTTPAHGINNYHVDIVANSEDQAKTSFDDVYEMLENGDKDLKRTFYWSKSIIENNRTGSYIKYNTAGAKTKAGKRSACMVFDEIYNYEDYTIINEMTASFGKKPHSRIFMISSNGSLREGVFDGEIELADAVLNGDHDELAMLPMIYAIDKYEDAKDCTQWIKANPSLPYMPLLQRAIEADYAEIKFNSEKEETFFTKRMGYPKQARELVVATFDELMTASGDIDVDLTGRDCVAGLDYALLSDMTSVGLLFRDGDMRYWIQHSWICRESADWNRIKAPLERWQEAGDLTIVNDVQIDPFLIAEWLAEQSAKYNIKKLAMDWVCFALMREVLEGVGFIAQQGGNVRLVRPLQIASVSPVIESWFRTGSIRWGEVPLMRWATNNTKRVRMKTVGASGNYKYDKIEAKSRKTDPFMAFVHAATLDEELTTCDMSWMLEIPAATS